jgi:Zn-dependent protease with chaperone function
MQMRSRKHLLSIVRHEMGHRIYNHSIKRMLLIWLYGGLLALATQALAKGKSVWLPMVGIKYDSMFLAMFTAIYFCKEITFALAKFVYNYVCRRNEYEAD